MGIPIAELQERVSSHDFAEYWVHYQLEPWGDEREDARAGIVASTIANVNRDKRKRAQPYRADEFVPRFESQIDSQDEDEELDEDEAAAHAAEIDELMASIGSESETTA